MVTVAEDHIIAEEIARAMKRDTKVLKPCAAPEQPQRPSVTQRNVSSIEKLPPELLLYIFSLVFPPIHQYDPSIVHGPQSAWMSAFRTRKALATTCKAFFGPATEVLYEDIVLRRMGQIPALARTLDPSRTPSAADMAALVRSIRMDSCVVWEPFADVVREELGLILGRCHALRAFSFHPHMNFSFHSMPDSEPEAFDAFDPAWLFTSNALLHPSLTHSLSALDLVLNLWEDDDFLAFHSFLGSASHLAKLKLRITMLCETKPSSLGSPRELSSLADLTYIAQEIEDWFLNYICHVWSLPQLRALTIIEPGELPVDVLLRTHGARLTYLHWRNEHLDYEQTYALDDIATSCPLLEHLVIQRFTAALPVVRSPTLRFLDFWASYETAPPQEVALGAFAPGSDTPRLERVRVLAGTPLHFELYPPTIDWPRLCHPLAVNGAEHTLWRFPAMCVVQTSWGVFFEDALYFYSHDLLNVVAPGPDMEPGETYEPGEDDEGDTTLGDFEGSIDQAEMADEVRNLRHNALGHASEDEPVNRDELLEMFHEVQVETLLLVDD